MSEFYFLHVVTPIIFRFIPLLEKRRRFKKTSGLKSVHVSGIPVIAPDVTQTGRQTDSYYEVRK